MFTARLRLLVAAALITGGSLVAAAASSGAGLNASTGWDATLKYLAVRPPAFPRVSDLVLRVTRGGSLVLNRAVPLPHDCAPSGCRLAPSGPGRPFALADLGLKAGPVAVIWLSTPGVHCCTLLQTVAIPGGRLAEKSFGSASARVATAAGQRIFLSADDRFSSLVAPPVAAALPIRIWRYHEGTFVDVTRSFPEQIAADAARWWRESRAAQRAREDARGVFAAWAADMCLLGKNATVTRELMAAVTSGAFSSPRTESGPAGAAYATALRAKLRAWRYCR